jgi:hypothetical protein
MPQDEFAAMVDEACNGWAAGGWRLVSAAGDYGARVTLGVWLIFAREAASAPDEPVDETAADEDVPSAAGLDEDTAEAPEPAWGEAEAHELEEDEDEDEAELEAPS